MIFREYRHILTRVIVKAAKAGDRAAEHGSLKVPAGHWVVYWSAARARLVDNETFERNYQKCQE